MNEDITSVALACKLWIYSALMLSAGILVYALVAFEEFNFLILIGVLLAATIGSVPALIVLIFLLPLILKVFKIYTIRLIVLAFVLLFISLLYGSFAGFIIKNPFYKYNTLISFLETTAIATSIVFASVIIALLLNIKYLKIYFSSSHKKIINMQENLHHPFVPDSQKSYSNKIWIKGLLTAGLILLMLIPTVFVSNLVTERRARQEEVKNEVSSKWAGGQSITFPYLFIPYNVAVTTPNGKASIEKRSFVILPENLNVVGFISTEQRQRSIYSVLLYNGSLKAKGNYVIQIPADVDVSAIDWNDSRICVGILDFKGIQQKVTVNLNNQLYDLSAGLPTNEIDTNGLSSPFSVSAASIGKQIFFEMPLKIKGSDQLHFTPLAGNSQFNITSNWNSPSFDGNTLPAERNLNNNGFEASWNFNKANLPFNTVFKNFNFKKDDYAFGVSLLQPADQYAKTLRCIKYAILFIGLTFSLFFIVEIMQKKPFHPVQYVLVGLALIVFFTLLLSISEFLLFDVAYLIAAAATVLLIALYAKSHFKSLKVSAAFAAVIGAVYGFIFILIRLEDTALLVGSIGLFVILALAMYISRKINWYGKNVPENAII